MSITAKLASGSYKNFISGSLSLNFAAVASSFELTSTFNSKDAVQRDLFRPMAFHEVKLYDEYNSLLITGVVTNVSFKVTPNGNTATIYGYSKTGVLTDCHTDAVDPSEYNNLSLKDLADKLCEPFGITVITEGDAASKAAEQAPVATDGWSNSGTSESKETVDRLLKRMASERGLIISHNEYGQLVITKNKVTGATIATYREDTPTLSFDMEVGGRDMHSKITVKGEADILYGDENTTDEPVENALVPVYREITKSQRTGAKKDALEFAKSSRSEELRSIRLKIATDRWYWWDGKAIYETITPNKLIDVISANIYLSKRTKWFVEKVNLRFTAEKNVASLTCVLPAVYDFSDPKSPFS